MLPSLEVLEFQVRISYFLTRGAVMLAKMTSKNQITIPKAISKLFTATYFDVRKESDRIVLVPLNLDGVDQVRVKLDEMGINEQDVADAVAWARK